MPTIVMAKQERPLEPVMKKKAFAFLEKLSNDDTQLGLHIEPIVNAADARVRTGRVDQGYRAVLFKVTTEGTTTYVFHGIWPHDEANRVAERTVLKVNPISGIAEIRTVEPAPTAPQQDDANAGVPKFETRVSPLPTVLEPTPAAEALFSAYGTTAQQLIELGMDEGFAASAMAITDEEGVLSLAEMAPAEWQGLALIDLSAGTPVEEVRSKLGLDKPVDTSGTADEQLIRGLQHPAGLLSFAWIEDDDELRRVVEDSDFAAWRIFLHPLQKQFVDKQYGGPAKVTGGAGTGKTVVALHRARALANTPAEPRVLLTTFTTNLAAALERDMRRLDPDISVVRGLGQPGMKLAGIDAVARSVLVEAGREIGEAAGSVLGAETVDVLQRTGSDAWREAIAAVGDDLPETLRSSAFMEAEYEAVVLPRRITSAAAYFRAPRRGRGVSLNRGQRAAVWSVVERYRAASRAHGTLDFVEAAAVAAAYLDALADRPYDHVLVDEGQDLGPTRWQLVRALVETGENDLFIAEDSHQRIYGQKITLSHYGIETRGRSRRLTLNYRTTQQNLNWAMGVLDGADFSDLEGEEEKHDDYRSARSGPEPQLLPCVSLTEELDQAARLIGEWTSEADVASETVAVLVRDRFQRDRVVTGLAERGVEVRAVDRESLRRGRPVVMTMYRAKGTEFARVLLFGVKEGAIPDALKEYATSPADMQDALLRERSLLYVAATRARDVLAVSWSGQPSPLLVGPHHNS